MACEEQGVSPVTAPRGPVRIRWAPWWAYLVPILTFNYLRQLLLPRSYLGDLGGVALFATVAVGVVAVVTLVHSQHSGTEHQKGN
jgi:hypothetical protein